MTKFPPMLEYWTADEVAECLDGLGNNLYIKLWSFVGAATNPTPLGGDGLNGTVETPDGRLDSANDDKTPHWWHKLTDDERKVIWTSCKMNR